LRTGQNYRQHANCEQPANNFRGITARKWSERQDLNLSTAIDYQAVTKPDTQGDSQIQVALGHDLSQVVTAWEKLPAPLKAAILAIIKTAE
jgi:hypothetical protein